MKIKQILMQPLGQRFNAGILSIKTYKKIWQVGDEWWSQIICMDETGEIPVDVNTGKKYNPIRGRGISINVIVAQVQNAEYLGKDRKKLVVEQYSMPSITISEWEQKQDKMLEDDKLVIRGKIRHGLVCAVIRRNPAGPIVLKLKATQKQEINELVEFVLTGE